MTKKPLTLQITAPHFSAGIIVGKSAPRIIGYMRDWPRERIEGYCNRRGWKVIEVKEIADDGGRN
jgi:hypothetical protein